MARMDTGLDSIRMAFERLTQREKLMVVVGGVSGFLVVLLAIALGFSNSISKTEHRINIKTDQLSQLLAMQGEYKARQSEQERRMRELARSKVRLVSLVEEAARKSQVEIGQLRPETGEPNSEGVVESRVNLRATGLSVDRLKDFLERIEKSQGVVVVKRLKMNKPFRKDTVDIELTITTYKVQS